MSEYRSRREAIRATRVPGEVNSGVPIELSAQHQKPLTLREEMMRFIRTEVSKSAQKQDMESFEEFDDFSIDDEEPDLTSPYTVEMTDEPGSLLLEPDPEPTIQESDENLSPEDRSEATGAEGAEDTEPARLTNNAAADNLNGSG